jgi:hypothetical protein
MYMEMWCYDLRRTDTRTILTNEFFFNKFNNISEANPAKIVVVFVKFTFENKFVVPHFILLKHLKVLLNDLTKGTQFSRSFSSMNFSC